MSEFSDRPLVAGSIRGLRTFRVNGDGVLTGVTQTHCEFKAGANDAICLADVWWPMSVRRMFGLAAHQAVDPSHQIASLHCRCGFYAYFDGSNDYQIYTLLAEAADPGQIRGLTGIIEGTGVVTVGSRGFRASKAELVALVEHHLPQAPAPWRARTIAAIDGAFALLNLSLFSVNVVRGSALWVLALNALAALICAGGALAYRRSYIRWRRLVGRAHDLLARVRANYPDVPWYASEAEALAAHPLSAPPAAVPSDSEAAS